MDWETQTVARGAPLLSRVDNEGLERRFTYLDVRQLRDAIPEAGGPIGEPSEERVEGEGVRVEVGV